MAHERGSATFAAVFSLFLVASATLAPVGIGASDRGPTAAGAHPGTAGAGANATTAGTVTTATGATTATTATSATSPTNGTAAATGGASTGAQSDAIAGFVVAAADSTAPGVPPEEGNLSNPPVHSATVELPDLDRSTPVDPYGFYEFEDLPAGTHTVVVSAPGYETRRREVTVGEGVRHDFRLNKTGNRYRVEVLVSGLETGVELAGADVRVGEAVRTTGEDGKTVVRELPPGEYDVEVVRSGYDSWAGTVSVGPNSKVVSVRLHGEPEHAIAGTVEGRKGQPVDHGTVELVGIHEGRQAVAPRRVDLSETGGTYEFTDLPPIPGGEYRLRATATGYETATASVGAGPNPAGLTTEDFDLEQLPTPTTVTVQAPVYRDRSGEPMPNVGAEVIVEGTDPVTGDVREVKYTGGDGQVEFSTLEPGTYEVQLTRYLYYQVRPPGVESQEGRLVAVSATDDPDLCKRTDDDPGAVREVGRECEPKLEFPNRTATVSIATNTANEFTFDRTPVAGDADLSYRQANGTVGENRTPVYEPAAGATVNLTMSEAFVDPATFDPAVRRNATGTFYNVDGNNYAVVELPRGERRVRTDDRGRVAHTLYPGQYDAETIKAVNASESDLGFGYFYGRSDEAFPTWVQSGRTTERTIELFPTWTAVEGRVVDAAHAFPIHDATVTLTGEGWDPTERESVGSAPAVEIPGWSHPMLADRYGAFEETYPTDGDGAYADRIPVDDYAVTTGAPAYRTSEESVEATRTNPAAVRHTTPLETNRGNVTLTLERYDIEYVDGDPVCGELRSSNTTPSVYSTRFDRSLPGRMLPPGDYRVTYPWEAPETVTIPPNGSDQRVTYFHDDLGQDDDLTCNDDDPHGNASITVVVSDRSSDERVADATVKLYERNDDGSRTEVDTARTDANGTVTFQRVQSYDDPASYEVRAYKDGRFRPEDRSVGSPFGGGENVRVSVGLKPAAARISVDVSGPDGGIEDAQVQVLAGGSGTSPAEGYRTGADGRAVLRPSLDEDDPNRFALPVEPGEYTVQVSKPGCWAPANDSYSYGATIGVPKTDSDTPLDRSRSVELRPIPAPTIEEVTVDRGPSTDSKGLFLQGVSVPATMTARIRPPPVPFEDPPGEVTLVANPGEGDREREFVVDLGGERQPDGTYEVETTFDIKDLPPGRNELSLRVRTAHGATVTREVHTDEGDVYALDVQETPGWLATLVDEVSGAAPPYGGHTASVGWTDLPIREGGQRGAYGVGPNVKVTVDRSGQYVKYGLEFELKANVSQDQPVGFLRKINDRIGFDGAVVGSLKVSFDGEKRQWSATGEGKISQEFYGDAATERMSSVLGFLDDLEVQPSAGGSAEVGLTGTYEGPADSRAFTHDLDAHEKYEGFAKIEVKGTIPEESINVYAPSVGTILDKVNDFGVGVELYATTSGKGTVGANFQYDTFPSALATFSPSPAGKAALSEKTTISFGVEVSGGLGVDVADGVVTGDVSLFTGLTVHATPSIDFPYVEKLTGKIGLKASLQGTWPVPDVKEKWTWAEGPLWTHQEGLQLRIQGRGAAPPPTAATAEESVASISVAGPVRYESVRRDRPWNRPNYSQFDWEPGTTDGSLVRNAFPHAAPTIAPTAGDEAQVVYARDDVTAPASNVSLRSATWDGDRADWSAPGTLPDSHGAASPAAASLGDGRTLAVWRSTRALDPGTNPLLSMDRTELRVAVDDGTGWKSGERLTDNDAYEGRPAVAGDAGRALVVWTETPTGYPMDRTGLDVRYAVRGGEATSEGAIATDVTLGSRPAVDLDGDRGAVAYAIDADGDPATEDDRRIVARTYSGGEWSGRVDVTAPGPHGSPSVVVTDDGVRIAWITDENGTAVHTARLADGTPEREGVAVRTPGLRDLHLVDGAPGQALVWRSFGRAPNTSATSVGYAVARDGGAFGSARTIEDRWAYGRLSVALDRTGKRLLVAGLATPNATGDGLPDLRFHSTRAFETGGTVRITDAATNRTTVTGSGAVTVTATVENTGADGTTATASVTVDGELAEQTEVTVPAGGSREVSLTVTLSTPGEHAIAVNGVPAGTVTVESGSTTDTTSPGPTATTSGPTDTGTLPSSDPDDGGGLPGWLLVLVALVVLALGAAAVYVRRERSGSADQFPDDDPGGDGGGASIDDTEAPPGSDDSGTDEGPPDDDRSAGEEPPADGGSDGEGTDDGTEPGKDVGGSDGERDGGGTASEGTGGGSGTDGGPVG